ncbi:MULTISPECIES: hypothetical protein [unclassified Helicobacter]|uniref:hypothetical protein n=1 Tax=unclassified Helicobacter TaxID=2593540 RepID=UPI00115F9D10|nr:MULTISPECIES: hypothetical protein [unclassified Helicobacter]
MFGRKAWRFASPVIARKPQTDEAIYKRHQKTQGGFKSARTKWITKETDALLRNYVARNDRGRCWIAKAVSLAKRKFFNKASASLHNDKQSKILW